jgi:hypothetical protein
LGVWRRIAALLQIVKRSLDGAGCRQAFIATVEQEYR